MTFSADYKSKTKIKNYSCNFLLLQLIAQSKRQQGEFIEAKLVLNKVLELQISIVQELQGGITAELCWSNPSSQRSLWEMKKPKHRAMSRKSRRPSIMLNGSLFYIAELRVTKSEITK
jgi:hypothetical protein